MPGLLKEKHWFQWAPTADTHVAAATAIVKLVAFFVLNHLPAGNRLNAVSSW